MHRLPSAVVCVIIRLAILLYDTVRYDTIDYIFMLANSQFSLPHRTNKQKE